MKTFVLVHGSWAGGWQWRPVRERLEAHGHRVLAPTLSGMADRHHVVADDMGLHTHVEDVRALLVWEDLRDVVLVGHSYGGMVVTGAAAAQGARLSHLVYLDAFLPRADEAAWDVLPWQREAFQELRLPEKPWLIRPVDQKTFFPELGEDFDAELLTPMPIATHTEAVGAAPEPGAIPSTYVHATAPAYFDDSAARAAADGMRVVDVAAGHYVHWTHADVVADLLHELATPVTASA